MKKIVFGFSPCPNDTYIFDALVNQKIDWKGLDFEFLIEDVEYLNKAALLGTTDVTKLSYFAFSKITNSYQMLNSGGALGSNCGPLLVSKNGYQFDAESARVAIPGINTTANLLLSLAFPKMLNKEEVLFSEIEEKVGSGEFDLGLIIHESRFTYQSKGLIKVVDLGEFWESHTNSPIPLGGIAVKREIENSLKITIDQLIHESISYAFSHPGSSNQYIKLHSQEMDDEVIKAHINLYVNDFSLELGMEGKKGVYRFFDELIANDKIKDFTEPLIVPN